jgi:CO/xanthine dehydrogenase FAD-binding subunit
VFAVDATPVRIAEAEEALRAGGPAAIPEAARLAQARVHPLTDATASAEYRAAMVPVFCERALSTALARASFTP